MVTSGGSAAFDDYSKSYFSAQQASLRPEYVVAPMTVADVSKAVASLTSSKYNGCQFAIRSGGHTPWAGASNIANRMVIDLRSLNRIELNADRSIVSVGAGATWDAVYEKLDPLGLTVNGSRSAGVGEFNRSLCSTATLTILKELAV